MTNIGPAQKAWASKSNEIKDVKRTGNGKLIAIKTYQREKLKAALQAEHAGTTAQHSSTTAAHESTQAEPSLATRGAWSQDRSRVLAFNFFCIPGSENTRTLSSHVFERWMSHHKFKRFPSAAQRQDYKTIIEGVLSNVLYADITGHSGVHLSRATGFLSIDSRYRPTTFNRRMLTVIDDLQDMGIINQIRGERWHRGLLAAKSFGIKTHAKQTELDSTATLKNLASSCAVVALEDFTFQTERQEVVILKRDKSSALVEYEDTPQTEKLRQQVKIINKSLEDSGDLFDTNIPTLYDQRRRFLVRKFTYGSLESGGRLSGGFWMSMKRTERPVLLRIKGETTVEIDYNCVMTHLAYAVAEEPLPHDGDLAPRSQGDLYAIPGLSPASRPGIKKFMSALYFKESLPTKFPQGVADLLTPEDRIRGCAYVLRQIQAAHEGISHLFGTGIGHYLQHLESRVMVNVMIYCARKNLTALPIHDCLIVGRTKREWALFIMKKVSKMVIGREIPCEVKINGKEEMEERDDEEIAL